MNILCARGVGVGSRGGSVEIGAAGRSRGDSAQCGEDQDDGFLIVDCLLLFSLFCSFSIFFLTFPSHHLPSSDISPLFPPTRKKKPNKKKPNPSLSIRYTFAKVLLFEPSPLPCSEMDMHSESICIFFFTVSSGCTGGVGGHLDILSRTCNQGHIAFLFPLF